MKRILICIGQLFGGGAERVVSVWSEQLALTGYETHILVYGRAENEYEIDSSIIIHTIVDQYDDYKKLSAVERLRRARRILKRIRPDVVISFLPRMQITVMLASSFLGIKRIETIRNNPWMIKHNNAIERILWNRCLTSSNAIIIQTKDQADYLPVSKRRKCHMIPNPVAQLYVRNEKKIYSGPIEKFIAIGRLSPQKNYKLMIDAFSDLVRNVSRNVTLDIYGAGSKQYKEELEEQIKRLGLETNIQFRGKSDNLHMILHEYDAFVMTSDFEGMPNALVEAMISGLVCLSTNCKTGPSDLISNEVNGYLVPVGSTEEVYKGLKTISQLIPERATEISENAIRSVMDKCSETNSRDSLIQLIEAL